MKYVQCKLERLTCKRNLVTLNTTRVEWVPAKYAVLGKVLKLKDDGKWVDGWVVAHVGASKENPLRTAQLVKAHRESTGDSLRRDK